MLDASRSISKVVGWLALVLLGALSACGGSSDDAAPAEPTPVVAAPAEPATSQHLNAGDAVFATFTTAAGETVQLSGDRDAAGLPAVIRSKITTRSDGTTTSTRKVDYDEQGRPVRATTDEGSLTLEYFTTGVARATFRPAGTDNLAFEIVIPDFGPPARWSPALRKRLPSPVRPQHRVGTARSRFGAGEVASVGLSTARFPR